MQSFMQQSSISQVQQLFLSRTVPHAAASSRVHTRVPHRMSLANLSLAKGHDWQGVHRGPPGPMILLLKLLSAGDLYPDISRQ